MMSSSSNLNLNQINSQSNLVIENKENVIFNPPKKIRQGRMYNDIEEMMYGFGDVWPPNPASVNLMEKLVTSYIEDLTERAIVVSELTGKLDKECFMYVVRKDRKKFNRIHQLITTNEELKEVQKVEFEQEVLIE